MKTRKFALVAIVVATLFLGAALVNAGQPAAPTFQSPLAAALAASPTPPGPPPEYRLGFWVETQPGYPPMVVGGCSGPTQGWVGEIRWEFPGGYGMDHLVCPKYIQPMLPPNGGITFTAVFTSIQSGQVLRMGGSFSVGSTLIEKTYLPLVRHDPPAQSTCAVPELTQGLVNRSQPGPYPRIVTVTIPGGCDHTRYAVVTPEVVGTDIYDYLPHNRWLKTGGTYVAIIKPEGGTLTFKASRADGGCVNVRFTETDMSGLPAHGDSFEVGILVHPGGC